MAIEDQFNPEQLHWIHSMIQGGERLDHQLNHRLDCHREWNYEQQAQIQALQEQVKELQAQVAQLMQANQLKVYDW